MRKLRLSNSKILLGIDEVGRGPWAGPLVIGAVILGSHRPEWDNLTDSKKLSSKKRTELNQIILKHAGATGLGWVTAAELDRFGLSNALKLACRRAVKQILATKTPFDEIIIDGTINFLADTPLTDRVSILKKADFLVKEVSAASIIAKVARDNYMIQLATKYPHYGFDRHVGYGTAAHKEALLKYGVCPEHRKSFRPIKELITSSAEIIYETIDPTYDDSDSHISTSADNTTAHGQRGEQTVIDYLVSQDHQIIAHNYKTKTYEIDIISVKEQKIYFTEVKYRENATHGTTFAQITPQKRTQMQYAAEAFLANYPEYNNFQPALAAAGVLGTEYQLEDWFVLD